MSSKKGRTTMRGYLLSLVLTGLVATGLLDCSIAAEGESEAYKLKALAEEFWRAQETEDWAKLYQLLSPRGLEDISQQQFIENKQRHELLHYSSVQVRDAEVDGDYGWVDISYRYVPKGYESLPPEQVRMWEVWRKESGVWRPLPSVKREEAPKLPPTLRSREDETILAQRVEQFWKARETKDWGSLYRLLEPAYRARESEQEFLKRRPIYLYLSHKPEWMEVGKGSGSGRSKINYSYKYDDPSVSKMAAQEAMAIEEWVRINGEWFRRMAEPPGAQANRGDDKLAEETEHVKKNEKRKR
jgi:hypothetical protein